MASVAADTGLLVALFDRGDRHHEIAIDFMATTTSMLVTNVAVITETAHMLSFSAAARADFLGWVARLEIDLGTAADLPRIVAIMAKYEDLPADFADASLVALCERRGISAIATFDSDFEVYRLKGRKRFTRVPTRPGATKA